MDLSPLTGRPSLFGVFRDQLFQRGGSLFDVGVDDVTQHDLRRRRSGGDDHHNDRDGERAGKLEEVYYPSDGQGEAVFARIKSGLLGRRSRLAPLPRDATRSTVCNSSRPICTGWH